MSKKAREGRASSKMSVMTEASPFLLNNVVHMILIKAVIPTIDALVHWNVLSVMTEVARPLHACIHDTYMRSPPFAAHVHACVYGCVRGYSRAYASY